MSEFESWLSAQLKALDTDDEVYLPYIVSILEDEDDKSGAIDDLLGGISDKDAENKALRLQILERWGRLQSGGENGEASVDGKLKHVFFSTHGDIEPVTVLQELLHCHQHLLWRNWISLRNLRP